MIFKLAYSGANVHDHSTEDSSWNGDIVHKSTQQLLPGQAGNAPGVVQLGNPDLDSPAGSWQANRGSVEHVALDNQDSDSETRVAPGRRGASAHACRGAGFLQQNVAFEQWRYSLCSHIYHLS